MIAYPPERKNSAVPSGTLTVIATLLLIIALSARAQASSSVSVAWNASGSSSISGYRLYQGVASGSYTNKISVNQTNATVSGLVAGVKYFFAVTAYTTTGLESPFSNEITYTPSTSTNGSAPVISLTSPTGGTGFQAPASISCAANVTANGHSISKVQFYNGSALLAEDTAAPYTYTWNNVGAGSYSLKAQLVYDSTNSMVSTPVSVNVSAPSSGGGLTFASTSGAISSPLISGNGLIYQTVDTGVTNGGRAVYTFNVPTAGNYTISAMAIATNSDQNSFYVNIDSDPTDPTMIWDLALSSTLAQTSVSWRGTGSDGADQFNPKVFALSQGTHQLIIIGREGYAQLGTITIVSAGGTPPPPVTAPAIVLNSPNNNSTYTAPATMSLAATVTTNGHTINKVQFYNGSTLLAEDTAAPYTYSWNNVSAGSYSLKAQLVYDSTNSMVSTPVSVSVSAPSSGGGLTFASTSGAISSPLISGNGVIYQTVDTGVTNGGRAVYTFNIPTAGNYTISAMAIATNSDQNSFYVNIDSDPTDPTMIWDLALSTALTQTSVSWRGTGSDGADQFNPKVFALSQGTHQLIIIGREGYAQLGTITIVAAGGAVPPPVTMPGIVLSSPNDGSTYTAPANLSLAATVTPNGHTINKVQFYNGSTLLVEDTAAPYSYTWNGVAAGSYTLRAQMVYDSTNTMMSSAANLTVAAPSPGPISFASTSGSISSPFVVSNGLIFQNTTTGVTGGGRAVYTFSVPTTGDYIISAMTVAPDSDHNSFYINIDSDPTDPTMIWDLALTSTLTQTQVSWRGTGDDGSDQFNPKVFNLTQGTHQLIILGREAGAQLGTITISPANVLPAPWQVLDIGNPGITGSASVSNGAYNVSGSGTLNGSSDSFRFLYQPMTGDSDLRARITSLQNTSGSPCVGVMVRETLTPGSKYAFVGVLPDGSVRSQNRASTASGSSAVNSGSLAMPNAWARLVRSNNSVLAYKSSDGASWTLVGSNSIVMATNIYFGLAVASGTNSALSAASLTNVVAVP
jgi:hypothetical protein